MITRIKSGGVFEDKVGYCRAVVANGVVYVAGTVAAGLDVPSSVTDQCRSALEVIDKALKEVGSGFENVVRVTYYLPNSDDFEPCWPILREVFGANPPASTVLICDLIDPKYKIEIEVTAVMPDNSG